MSFLDGRGGKDTGTLFLLETLSRVATAAHFGLLVREMDSEVVVGRGVVETEVVEEPGVVRAVD
jgi:hypothetical protein